MRAWRDVKFWFDNDRRAIVGEIRLRANGYAGGLSRECSRFLRGGLRAHHDRRAVGERIVDAHAILQRHSRTSRKRSHDDRRVYAIERGQQLALEFAAVHACRIRNVTRVLGDRRNHNDVVRARFSGVVHAYGDIRLAAG